MVAEPVGPGRHVAIGRGIAQRLDAPALDPPGREVPARIEDPLGEREQRAVGEVHQRLDAGIGGPLQRRRQRQRARRRRQVVERQAIQPVRALVGDHQPGRAIGRQRLGIARRLTAPRLDRLPAAQVEQPPVGGVVEGGAPERAAIARGDQPAAVGREPEPGQAAEARVPGAEDEAGLEGEPSETREVRALALQLDAARSDQRRAVRLARGDAAAERQREGERETGAPPAKQKAREKLAGLDAGAGQDGYSRVAPNRWSSITNMLMKSRYRLSAPMIALRVTTSAPSAS